MPLDASALTTAAAVLEDLPSGFTGKEARIESMINGVSLRMARFCNRNFEDVSDLVEEAVSNGNQFLRVQHAPVSALTSVELLADDGTVIDTFSDVYIWKGGKAGLLFRRNGFPLGGSDAPSMDAQSILVPTANRLRVTYSGGWVTPGQAAASPNPARTLPADLEEQCITEVVTRFMSRGRNRDIDSHSTEGATVTFRQGGDLLRGTKEFLKTYWLEA